MNPLLVNSIVKKMKPSQASNQSTQGLPSWAKGIIAVTVLAGAAFVAYKVYKFLQKAGEGKDEKETIRLVDVEIKEKIKAGDSPSFALSKYNSTASTIETLLAGFETEASEKKVVELVIDTVKKPIDWLLLARAFGKRNVDDAFFGTTAYDLGGLLKEQLDHIQSVTNNINTPNFKHSKLINGKKTYYEILKVYLDKIGVKI